MELIAKRRAVKELVKISPPEDVFEEVICPNCCPQFLTYCAFVLELNAIVEPTPVKIPRLMKSPPIPKIDIELGKNVEFALTVTVPPTTSDVKLVLVFKETLEILVPSPMVRFP